MRRRRWLKAAVLFLLGAATCLAALLFFFNRLVAGALPPVLGRLGVHAESVSRMAGGGVEARGLVLPIGAATVSISRVQLPPPARLACAWFRRSGRLLDPVMVEAIALAVGPRGEDRNGAGATPAAMFEMIGGSFEKYADRLPPVEIGQITLADAAGREFLEIADVRLAGAGLSASAVLPYGAAPVRIEAFAEFGRTWRARLDAPEESLSGSVLVASSEGALSMDAVLSRQGQILRMDADLAGPDWMPARAGIMTDGFTIKGEWLRGGDDLQIERLEWALSHGMHYGVVEVSMQTGLHDMKDVKLDAGLVFRGEGGAIEVEDFAFRGGDWISGRLERPFLIHVSEGAPETPMNLRFDADLHLQDILPLDGNLQCDIDWLISHDGRPELTVAFRSDRISGRMADSERSGDNALRRLPELRGLDLHLEIDAGSLDLTRLELSLNRSRLGFSGGLPLVEAISGFRKREGQLAGLSSMRGVLEVSEWLASDWSGTLPAFIRPSGVLNAVLSVEPGLAVSGVIEAEGFSVRPTRMLPALSGIGGVLRIENRTARLEQLSAAVGGSPVSADGFMDLSRWPDLEWSASVRGRNVPLVRSPNLVLRSDVDLLLAKEAGEVQPLLAGRLDLRSGVLLVTIDPLSPRTAGAPAVRPPFFSVEHRPFSDWRFDVAISGTDFMRTRGPNFDAVLSAALELKSTFGEPLLTGVARATEAELRFPGAVMLIDRGEVMIAPGREDEIQLDIAGVARRASHVVTLHVSNTLDDPHAHLHSTPGLSNAAIMRLLATGSLGGQNVGGVGLYLGQALIGPQAEDRGFVERVSLSVGQETSSSGRDTVEVRYDLSDRWYLKGEYDKYDAYNLDLVWTVFEK